MLLFSNERIVTMSHFEQVDLNKKPIITTIMERADHSYPGFFHYHQGIELLFIHEGAGMINVNQKNYSIQANTLFIFQPFQLHRVTVTDPHSYVRSMFHFEPIHFQKKLQAFPKLLNFLEILWKRKLNEHCYHHSDFFVLLKQNIIHTKKWLAASTHHDLDEEEATLLLIQILSGFSNSFNQEELTHISPEHRIKPHVEKMIEWIEQHYHEDFKLQRIADDLHLSKYYASHLFKEHTGYAITDYIMARRLKEACLLLVNTDHTIENIGHMIGVPDASYFTKFFKKRMGMTPKKYRDSVNSTFQNHHFI
jgi:YesN/AraC family two-component response regulator